MGKKAWAILAKMQRTKAGFKPKDFEALYVGFGFDYVDKGGHRKYFHPKYPDLVSPVGRHGKLTAGYVDDAVDTINLLIKREGLNDK